MRTDVYWIPGPWRGRLAIAARPRGGDWLEDEVHSWRRSGLNVIVSLLMPDEIAELDLRGEEQACRKHAVEFVSLPIADRGVPDSPRETLVAAQSLADRLAAGKNVAVHCRQGIGRSALVAACVLVLGGRSPEAAFHQIYMARGCPVPDTAEQREWVEAFAADLQVAPVSGKN